MTIRRHRRRLTALPAALAGLRPRLVLTFVIVALISGAAAAGASYVSARTAVLEEAQQPVLDSARTQLANETANLTLPMDQAALDDLASRIPGEAVVLYGKLQSPQPDTALKVPESLRQAVHRQNHFMWQRVERPDGLGGTEIVLVYGTTIADRDGNASGVEIYQVASLASPQRRIQELAWSAGLTTALSLVAAVLIALFAARGVLRPVRDLRTAALQLAAGELDVRLRVRGSDELADLVLTFNNTAADLERSVDQLRRLEANARRFVADVSHELRSPLAAMTAVTDTLDEEALNLDGDAATAAGLVSTETRRLAQLVENLIEITRFDAGRATLRLDGEVDLAAAIAATLAARGWTDQVETTLPAGITGDIDRRRLDVIVANLVGNALRHGAAPVTISIAADTDTAGAEWVHVSVTDRGSGLPPEIAPHVFERFYKADAARARSEGSGLGLAIALENARLHGGTIEAANRQNGGALFHLRLPRRQADSAHPTSAHPTSAHPTSAHPTSAQPGSGQHDGRQPAPVPGPVG